MTCCGARLWNQGRLHEGGTGTETRHELEPQFEDAYYGLGLAYLSEKHPQQARETFLRLLRVNPKSPDAHFGLGAVSSDEQKYSTPKECIVKLSKPAN
jgi:Tfp pilus assembly protein PilF